jgi:ribosomal-protein-alanine N-acetyltransferase
LALAEDAPALAATHAQAFDRPWDEIDFREILTQPGMAAFIAEAGDPAGLAICRIAGGEAEILTIAVTPWARRRGVARALMTAAIGAAQGAGASEVFLEVDIDNLPAIGLYTRLGFIRSGLRRGYYDRGAAGRADALVMRLDLTRAAH